jgi:hypothetical protein
VMFACIDYSHRGPLAARAEGVSQHLVRSEIWIVMLCILCVATTLNE